MYVYCSIYLEHELPWRISEPSELRLDWTRSTPTKTLIDFYDYDKYDMHMYRMGMYTIACIWYIITWTYVSTFLASSGWNQEGELTLNIN